VSGACFQYLNGRLVQTWISLTGPSTPERITSIPNGVDLERFPARVDTEELRRELGLTPESRVIMSVGRFVPVKNFPILVRSFARIHAHRPETRLLLVGAGDPAELRGLAESLGVAASFVRRLLVPLTRDGIVESSLGKRGGVRMARSPKNITLRDIYCSVTDDKPLWTARPDIPCQCVASANIGEFFEGVAKESITPRDVQLVQSFNALSEDVQREVEEFIAFKRSKEGRHDAGPTMKPVWEAEE